MSFRDATLGTGGSSPPDADLFRLVLEASPTGMMMVDERGAIVLVNAQIEALFGYAREALIGRDVTELVPHRFREKHPHYRADFLRSPQARPMGAGRELFGLRADGAEVPIEIGLNPLRTRDGLFVLASVVDISARKHADAEREALLVELRGANAELERRGIGLRDALAERETMLQEIHHRVKNNLQIISSLLRMQVRQRASSEARAALEDCEARVQAMALLHEQLYDSADYARVSLARYVTNIVQNVLRAAEDRAHGMRLETALDGVTLSVDRAIPCGLIVSELVTNTLRHARARTLSITLSHVDQSLVRLVVRDDGVGLPEGFALGRSSSRGHHLVVALTRQLDGQLELGPPPGTTFTITFPREAPHAA